jgi:DNA polymerase-3 subunit gamma/tau
MLSQSAFNAFLKTLEEPPSHAIFVLATTEKHKIIPTILSRCQIFDFNRIRVEDAVDYLKLIADKENLDYEEDALHVIGQKADGAMRDALSIFDQVVSFSEGKITYQDVIHNLNILDYEYYFKLTFSLLEGDVAASMLLFNEVLERGFDSRNFINGYAAHLRDLMVCKNPETVRLMEVGAGIKEKYLAQSGEVTLPFLYSGLEICNQADIQFRSSRNQRLTIELALVKLASLSEGSKKKTISDPPAPDTQEKPEPEPVQTPVQENKTATPEETIAGENNVSGLVRTPGISIKDSLKGTVTIELPVEEIQLETEAQEGVDKQDVSKVDTDAIIRAWNDYASSVKKNKPRIYSTLANNKPLVREDGVVQVVLNSEVQRDNFVKNIKSDLTAFIRETSGVGDVEILAEVSEKEQNGKKIYTEQDKLEYLVRKNPDLGKLKVHFNLDFDD